MYNIKDHYTGKVYVLSGGTKLEGFKTKEEAEECLSSVKKAMLNESVTNIWLAYVAEDN